MTEPTAGLITGVAATAGLAAVEAATGISFPLFVWGMVGGLWAYRYLEPMTPFRRLSSLAIAALVAGVCAKPAALILIGAAAHYMSWWPAAVDDKLIAIPLALVIGLLCHTVIGKKLIELAGRGADGVLK